jgi:CheY-like chemotaxis protein
MTNRVLYVEDDDDMRRLMAVLLVKEGYEVISVASAEDAMTEMRQRNFDILLTDYNLPNKNADWMLSVARAEGWVRNTAIVILTSTEHPEGVDGYRVLRKGVDIAHLFAELDDAMAARTDITLQTHSNAVCDARQSLCLKLYVTGQTRESKKAIRNLARALKDVDPARVSLEVHDLATVAVSADLLEEDRIVVTPTLVRTHPLPKIWLFGDLSRTDLLVEMISASSAEHGD